MKNKSCLSTGIKENTGAALDDIPKFVFEDNASKLAEIITYICNKSLGTGAYPRGLTVPRITCIFKAASRAIALLPCVSKILDEIVENQLQNYLASYEPSDPKQFGFC